MYRWEIWYRVGNTYKYKIVIAKDSNEAIRKARVKNITEVIKIGEATT